MEQHKITVVPHDKLQLTFKKGIPMQATLILQNNTLNTMFFWVYSTLDRRLIAKPDTGEINPSTSVPVDIAINFQANIQYVLERLAIACSADRQVCGFVIDSNAERHVLRLEVGNLPEIPSAKPEFIRVNESVMLKTKGNQLFKEGDYGGALQKFHEAIMVYRYDTRYFTNLIQTLIKLKRYKEGLEATEIALLFDVTDPKILYYKAILFVKISQHESNLKAKLFFLDQSFKLLSLAKHQASKSKSDSSINQIEQALTKVKLLQGKVGMLTPKQFSAILITKAQLKSCKELQNIQGLSTLFKDQNQFNQYLGKALRIRDAETPDYVLDPLSYQIMKKPLILPTGVSYDQHIVQDFFKHQGIKDPISKTPINPNLIFNNLTLQSFIGNSQMLGEWQQIEASILHENDDIEF